MTTITLNHDDFDDVQHATIEIKANAAGLTKDEYIQLLVERKLRSVCNSLLEGLSGQKIGTVSPLVEVH